MRRRGYLLGLVAAAALAGCSGDTQSDESGDRPETAQEAERDAWESLLRALEPIEHPEGASATEFDAAAETAGHAREAYDEFSDGGGPYDEEINLIAWNDYFRLMEAAARSAEDVATLLGEGGDLKDRTIADRLGALMDHLDRAAEELDARSDLREWLDRDSGAFPDFEPDIPQTDPDQRAAAEGVVAAATAHVELVPFEDEDPGWDLIGATLYLDYESDGDKNAEIPPLARAYAKGVDDGLKAAMMGTALDPATHQVRYQFDIEVEWAREFSAGDVPEREYLERILGTVG